MNNTFRYTLIPVILGANLRARLLAEKILLSLRVRSYVMSDTYHPALFLSPALRYRKISGSNSYANFVISELIRFAEEQPDKLLVLIATTPYYRALIGENQAELEKYYILSDTGLSFLVRESVADMEIDIKGERA